MKLRTFTQAEAMADPTNHAFAPNVGYLRAVKPLPPGPVTGGSCAAPGAIAHGSRHLLQPPGGAKPVVVTWHEPARAWLAVGGRRLAFTPAYLASHGWTYRGPMPSVH